MNRRQKIEAVATHDRSVTGAEATPWHEKLRLVVQFALFVGAVLGFAFANRIGVTLTPGRRIEYCQTASFDRVGHFGALPRANLTEGTGGTLYGTTPGGGEIAAIVFRLDADGTGLTVLHDFGNDPASGGLPMCGRLEACGGMLYGTLAMPADTGTRGAVFRLNQDGTGFGLLRPFQDSVPCGRLAFGDQRKLFGTTYPRGRRGGGTVFSLSQDGIDYRILHDFQEIRAEGAWPWSGVILGTDGALYGTTHSGGGMGCGTVYRLHPDGSGFEVLHCFGSFDGDGEGPFAGLLEAERGVLFGTTYGGGRYELGTVFRMRSDGSDYRVLHSFMAAHAEGGLPTADLVVAADGTLYGTTQAGGHKNEGTIFKLNRDGRAFRVVHSFGSTKGDGRVSYAGLLASTSGSLYGSTEQGGAGDMGTIFRLQLPKRYLKSRSI
jgi:uncharacterized repeat protein (TIGR03803 family)